MAELFNCHTGRTVAYVPRVLAHGCVVLMSRLTGRTYDWEVR